MYGDDTDCMATNDDERAATHGDHGPAGGEPPGDHHLVIHLASPNRVVAVGALVIATALISWIVFLGFTLPPRYTAGHWRLLWIGYDVAEAAVLVLVAWTAWFRRQALGTMALVAAVLLLCDAWFDIVTSWGHGDQWVTLATGLGAEIPLALLFLWVYRRLVLQSLAAFHAVAHDGVVTTRLFDAPFLFLTKVVGPPAGRGSSVDSGSDPAVGMAGGVCSIQDDREES
jgi:hypothetical protein